MRIAAVRLTVLIGCIGFLAVLEGRGRTAMVGSISGTVTEAGTGTPLSNYQVRIFNSSGVFVTGTNTDGSGAYLIGGLAAGTYYARTFLSTNQLHIDELYNNIDCPSFCSVTSGTPIVVADDATTSGINFTLAPAGNITGIVTSQATGLPISGASVQLFVSEFSTLGSTTTNASGVYTFSRRPLGTYYVKAQATGFVPELYDDVACPSFCSATIGTPVLVTAGATTGNIDLALTVGGTLSGTVTDALSGLPIAGMRVVVFEPNITAFYTTQSDGSGNYSVVGLATGTYVAQTQVDTQNYLNESYDDIQCEFFSCPLNEGTPIPVTAGGTVNNINFALTPGGTITGVVTDSNTGLPIPNVRLSLNSTSGGGIGDDVTDATGVFAFTWLRAGTYFVRTELMSDQNYVDELYNNIACPADCAANNGTPINVATGATVSGINVSLAVGGIISGTIVDEVSGEPMPDAFVSIYQTGGAHVGFAATNASGQYSVAGLPTGQYLAQASAQGYVSERYDNLPCLECLVTAGTPIAVQAEQTTSNVNFALVEGGVITGTVRDAASGNPVNGNDVEIEVALFSSDGRPLKYNYVQEDGTYTLTEVPTGTYFVRTWAFEGYIDEIYNNKICIGRCDVTVGDPVAVTAGETTSGVDFSLEIGGEITGTVTNAVSAAAIKGVDVLVYAASGALARTTITEDDGTFSIVGLPTGTYYARTANSLGYLDEIFDNQLHCSASCLATSGVPIAVTAGATEENVDFSLAPATELIQNGDFSDGLANWGLFATPNMSYIASRTTGSEFGFYRVPPPPGTSNQAVILQGTGAALATGTTLVAQFDLGNSSPLRRRISVLLHDGDFSDLSVCTFWLPPDLEDARFTIRTFTTKAWTNATISFYAASADLTGGYYFIDNVSLVATPAPLTERVDCLDPLAPPAPGGAASANLLQNGDFSSGLTGWGLFGQIIQQIVAGVFEFIRPAGVPAGVILQGTGQTMANGEIMTASFSLGNSSAVRKRVTVLLHEGNFTDLSACTFWLEPGQPLAPYSIRMFATKPWINATVSVYPATVGLDQWIRLDNVTLQRTPGSPMAGTECVEPGGG